LQNLGVFFAVHTFCGWVESGTSQTHCLNFQIKGEIQTVLAEGISI